MSFVEYYFVLLTAITIYSKCVHASKISSIVIREIFRIHKQEKHCILKKHPKFFNFKKRSPDHFKIVLFICCASHKLIICVVVNKEIILYYFCL